MEGALNEAERRFVRVGNVVVGGRFINHLKTCEWKERHWVIYLGKKGAGAGSGVRDLGRTGQIVRGLIKKGVRGSWNKMG